MLPKAIPIIYGLLLAGLLAVPRVLFRWLKEDYKNLLTESISVLVVGAGQAGEGVIRDLLRSQSQQYKPIAIVDDNPATHWREIHGVRVVGTCDEIPDIVAKMKIKLIFIAMPSVSSVDMRRIVDFCEQAHVPCRTLPGLKHLADGHVSVSALREVALEDLLGREEVKLNWKNIDAVIHNKTVLVSGGAGSIGSELSRQIAERKPAHLVLVDNTEFNLYAVEMELQKKHPQLSLTCALCDVTDRVGIEKLFAIYQPNIVFHAAAYKHVPLLELQLRAAVHNNIVGTRIIADIAARYNVGKFVLISSDKAVNPTNIMGATKRAAEVYCQNLNFETKTRFITVRFGNVIGSAGSVVPLFRKQLSEGGPLTVTHPEITRFFMTIPEACQLILQAASMGKGGEIFVLDMGEPIKIRYLAEQLIKLSGKVLGEDIQVQYIGLRPGEKLYEELFHVGETFFKTSHEKIRQAQVRKRDLTELATLLDKMEAVIDKHDDESLKSILLQVVPEYHEIGPHKAETKLEYITNT